MRNGTLSSSHTSARKEIETLLANLQLPERGRGMAHLQARHEWFERISRYYRELGSGEWPQ
jgi:chromosome partitioning protein